MPPGGAIPPAPPGSPGSGQNIYIYLFKSIYTAVIHLHMEAHMSFKQGDKVTNIFTKEVGVVVKVKKDGTYVVRYDLFCDDPQKSVWLRLCQ